MMEYDEFSTLALLNDDNLDGLNTIKKFLLIQFRHDLLNKLLHIEHTGENRFDLFDDYNKMLNYYAINIKINHVADLDKFYSTLHMNSIQMLSCTNNDDMRNLYYSFRHRIKVYLDCKYIAIDEM